MTREYLIITDLPRGSESREEIQLFEHSLVVTCLLLKSLRVSLLLSPILVFPQLTYSFFSSGVVSLSIA